MDELKEKFGRLEERPARQGFHTRIVNYILDNKLKAPFYILLSISAADLLFSAVTLFNQLETRESFSAIGASFDSFAPTSEFFSELAMMLKESFPWHALIAFLFNLAFVSYAAYLVFRMKKFNARKVV